MNEQHHLQDMDRLTADLHEVREAQKRAGNGSSHSETEFAPPAFRSTSIDPNAPRIHAVAMESAYLSAAVSVEETIDTLQTNHEMIVRDLRSQAQWLRSQGSHLAAIVHDHVAFAAKVHTSYTETHEPENEGGVACSEPH
jgi:hypothetical protein